MSHFPVPGRNLFTGAIPAPGSGPQQWAGAPSAVRMDDGSFVLTYRRRSSGDGIVVVTSRDGEPFDTELEIGKEQMDSAMIEWPALARLPDGRWRMYTS
ncbi:MAG: hypothetical protein WKF81_13135 [Thermomicrobiales bacterium]